MVLVSAILPITVSCMLGKLEEGEFMPQYILQRIVIVSGLIYKFHFLERYPMVVELLCTV